MAKLSAAQIAGIVKYQGGSTGSSFVSSMMNPDTDGPIFVAIALAESGGETTATNRNSNGSTDYGLWQINSIHSDLLSGNQPWSDPNKNYDMAATIYRNADFHFTPWTTYKNGKYLAFMGEAAAAYANPDQSATQTNAVSDAVNTVSDAASAVSNLNGLYQSLQNPQTWVRIGMGIAGILILAIIIAPTVIKTAAPPQVKAVTKLLGK